MYYLLGKRGKSKQVSPVWLVIAAMTLVSLYMLIFGYTMIIGGVS